MKNILKVNFFSIFGLFWVAIGWLALISAMAGLFYIFGIVILGIILFGFFTYIFIQKKSKINLKYLVFLVFIFSILLAIAISFFTIPSVFSGRDEGTFSSAAIMLSKNHKISTSFPAEQDFFRLYGPGEALNFPGFNYDQNGNLIPHFQLGYIAWLAVFYSLFSLSGLAIANSISLILFLTSFYLIARNYLEKTSAFLAFLLASSVFTTLWFSKFTLSENLAWALIWFGILQLILFLKEKNKFYIASFLLSFGLLLFVRVEAFAFLAMSLVVLFFQNKNWNNLKKIFDKKIVFLGVIILLLLISSFFINQAFYRTFAKGFLSSFNFYKNNLSDGSGFTSSLLYLLGIFLIYAVLNYIILGLVGLFYFLKKKNFEILIPFFILLPAFIYLINPSISLDHPWMLRRFAFAIIPVSILYSVIFLDHFLKKKVYIYLILILFLLTNLSVSLPFLYAKENNGLLQAAKNLSQNFSSSDLVLVDREASGNAWAMIAGPMNFLFGKQAVYFFNPKDLQKINTSNFSRAYLVIPDKNLDFYLENGLKNKIAPVKDYKIENNSLEISPINKKELSQASLLFPVYSKNYIYGKIYLYKN